MDHYVSVEAELLWKFATIIFQNFLPFSLQFCIGVITVSQPKLRRICVDQPLRTNHEDVQKSQTYQQFIRTMESEIRRLDTDSVYNHGKKNAQISKYFCYT